MGSEFSAPHEAAAASGEASPEQIVVPPSALHQRQERAATWHHRGQQQRMYEHTPWPRSANGPSTQHSDSESEASFDHNSGPPSSLSRTSSSARLKRSFSQHSDCSDIGTCTPDEAGASLTNDDPDASSSGTWPRLPKRSSRSRMAAHDALDVWELTRALAREKSDLADQLARMTAQETDVASPYPPRPLSATVATAEHANHSLPIFDSIGRPTCKSFDARIAELDNLVAAEQVHHHQQIDDRTLNSILGALQDQFSRTARPARHPRLLSAPAPQRSATTVPLLPFRGTPDAPRPPTKSHPHSLVRRTGTMATLLTRGWSTSRNCSSPGTMSTTRTCSQPVNFATNTMRRTGAPSTPLHLAPHRCRAAVRHDLLLSTAQPRRRRRQPQLTNNSSGSAAIAERRAPRAARQAADRSPVACQAYLRRSPDRALSTSCFHRRRPSQGNRSTRFRTRPPALSTLHR